MERYTNCLLTTFSYYLSIILIEIHYYFSLKITGIIHKIINANENEKAFSQSPSIKNSMITTINNIPKTSLTSFVSFSLFIDIIN